MAEQAGALAEEEQKPRPVKLEYEQVNGIRHAVETLDEGKVGQVAKSKLQVMCASICRDLGVSYSAEDLTSFRDETTSLSCRDFVEYLQEELLPKGKCFASSNDLERIEYHSINSFTSNGSDNGGCKR